MSSEREHNGKTNHVLFQHGAIVDASPCLALLGRWNTELMSFYGRRFQQYFGLPLSFLACRSANDAVGVQVDFYRRLIDDYRSEAQRLFELANQESSQREPDDYAAYSAKLLKAQEDAKEIIRQARLQAERIVATAGKEAAGKATAEEATGRIKAA